VSRRGDRSGEHDAAQVRHDDFIDDEIFAVSASITF